MQNIIIRTSAFICMIYIGLYSSLHFRFDFLILVALWALLFFLLFLFSARNKEVIKKNNYLEIPLKQIDHRKYILVPIIIVGHLLIFFLIDHFNINTRLYTNQEKSFFIVVIILFITWKIFFYKETTSCYFTPYGIEKGILFRKIVSFTNLESFSIDENKAIIELIQKDKKKYKFKFDRGLVKNLRNKLEIEGINSI